MRGMPVLHEDRFLCRKPVALRGCPKSSQSLMDSSIQRTIGLEKSFGSHLIRRLNI